MTDNAPKKLPTATRMLLQFLSVSVINGIAIVGYVKLAYAGTTRESVLISIYIPLAVLLPVPFVTYGAWHVSKVRARLQDALDRGVAKIDLPPRDVVFVLRMHRWFVWVKLAMWTVGALGWPAFVLVVKPEEATSGEVIDALAGLGLGVTSGALVFYVFEVVSRRRIAPLLLPETLEHLRPFPPFRIWQHILLLVVTLGVVQPFTLFTLQARTGDSSAAAVYLVVFFLLVAAGQARGIVLALSGSSGDLDAMMSRVRDGDLSTRARILSLDTFGRLSSNFNTMVEGLEQRERMRELFGRYVTTQVADEILEGRVRLGGERRKATVLFSDIRGFTAMSEKLTPEAVVAFLNRYFEEMIDCVIEHGGTIDKFIGDAVMAVFGVPTSLGTDIDAKCAASCALEMIERLERLNREREAQGESPIHIGIALHSGELVAGAIGSTKRMEYTVIGDTVNLTSRLEGLTKRLGRTVVVSADTARLIEDNYSLEPLEAVPVRGRVEGVEVFALAARKASAPTQTQD